MKRMRGETDEILFSDHAIKVLYERGVDPEHVIELLREPHFQQRASAQADATLNGRMCHYFPHDGQVLKKSPGASGTRRSCL
jgi:hypothetical protein